MSVLELHNMHKGKTKNMRFAIAYFLFYMHLYKKGNSPLTIPASALNVLFVIQAYIKYLNLESTVRRFNLNYLTCFRTHKCCTDR